MYSCGDSTAEVVENPGSHSAGQYRVSSPMQARGALPVNVSGAHAASVGGSATG